MQQEGFHISIENFLHSEFYMYVMNTRLALSFVNIDYVNNLFKRSISIQ